MKIYLASRFSRRQEMRLVRDMLASHGHYVTSRWIDLHDDIKAQEHSFVPEFLESNPGFCATYTQHDIEDLTAADCVVSFTGQGDKGDRHVEFGLAVALGKILILVGPRENVFHTLPSVIVLPDAIYLPSVLLHCITVYDVPCDWLDSSGRFLFGKHRGRTVPEVIKDTEANGSGYIRWALDTVDDMSDGDREILEQYLRLRGRA
jgi:hypothetical protein